MRIALYIGLGLSLAALQPTWAENVVASAAAILLECLPYLVASAFAAPFLRGRARALAAYAGCGCGDGPSARSIPAAIATALIFGSPVAVARVVIAACVARRWYRTTHEHETTLTGGFVALAPTALLAATAATIATNVGVAGQPLVVQIITGLLLGACASPCALGSVALAASLRGASPIVAYAVLATAGFIDVRRWLPRSMSGGADAFAYALLAIATALAAFDGGAQLVSPRLTALLFGCVPCLLLLAFRARGSTNVSARLLAAALLAAVIIGAPPPSYHATETTLAETFPGESIDFTGRYARTDRDATIARFAITCCRADAEPIALELAQSLPVQDAVWMNVRGTITSIDGRNVLRVNRYRTISPPSDPFIYR